MKNKKFIIIITYPRTSSTTLCNKFNLLDEVHSGYEIFNLRAIKRNGEDIFKILEKSAEDYLQKAIGHVPEPIICIKIFYSHMDYENLNIKRLRPIFTNLNIGKIIFLHRNLKDSYNSNIRAITTGNWGVTPARQKINEKNGHIGFKIEKESDMPQHLKNFDTYSLVINSWMDDSLNLAKELNLPIAKLTFEQVIDEKFDPSEYL